MLQGGVSELGLGLLDRDAATRLGEDALDAAWAEDGARLLRLRDGLLPMASVREDHAELALIPTGGARSPEHWYLGRVDGLAVFAVALPRPEEGDAASEDADEPAAGWIHPFEVGARLDGSEKEMMIVALALAGWHRSAAFSPRDGRPTTISWGGWARIDEHGGEHFPRTDPAVIVLVEHENRLLLGSNVLWETGRFSLLAGFVEAGESAEQAVVREIYEEAGVSVEQVRYVSSQSWPFPRSLMLGFRARLAAGADPDDLHPDPSEISELRWFTRDELREPAAGLSLPRNLSIARALMDLWIAEGDG